MSFQLLLPEQIYKQMIEQAQAELPNECCGILAAQLPEGLNSPPKDGEWLVERCYPLINRKASPTRYESDGQSMLAANKDMRERGLVEAAVYHSHPTSPPVPSKTDLELNYSEDIVNLIISLQSAEPELRAWWLTAEGYTEVKWELTRDKIQSDVLRFLWWNVSDFAHFTRDRISEERWPNSAAEYSAKCERVDQVLTDTFGQTMPQILAFAEITNQAANDVQKRLLPDHKVLSLDLHPNRHEFQVAILYHQEVGIPIPPLTAPNMPRGTRPMAVLDLQWPGHRIRLIACHWTARFQSKSHGNRGDLARFLSERIHEFMDEGGDQEQRHILIVGDFNEEPFGILEEGLHASRDRASSRRSKHYTDKDIKRIRLYNCGWRHLGERDAHPNTRSDFDVAGTYYWRQEKKWLTFDQVIVSGTLLTNESPYFEEAQLEIISHPLLFERDGLPDRFQWNNGNPAGVSDHLPLRGVIRLSEE